MVFALVVLASSLSVGAVHTPTVCILAAVGGFALMLFAATDRVHLSRGTWPFLFLVGFTLLQAIPLPASLVEALDADLANTWARAYELVGRSPQMFLSLDPGATRVEVLKLLLYAVGWVVAHQYARQHGARHAATVVFSVALMVLAASLAHRIAGARLVFGLYEPTYAQLHPGPLLNKNNESGLLNLGAFCGLGLFLSARRSPVAAGLSLVGGSALLAGSIFTGSRGGAGSLSVGFALVCALLAYHGLRRGRLNWRRLVALLFAVLGGVVLFVLATSSPERQQLSDPSLRKIEVLSWFFDIVAMHPWTGVGRGALGSEIGRFRQIASNSVFEYAENWPLEYLAGWGLVVGLAAVGVLLFALNPGALLRRTSSLHLAIYVGLVVLLIHNLVDLGLEVPGVALPAVVLLATLWGSRDVAPGPAFFRPRKLPVFTLGATAIIGSGLILAVPSTKAREERRALAILSRAGELTLPAVRQAVTQHPGDAYILRLGALAAFQARDASALRWLNRSLSRDPNNGHSYLLLAQVVQAYGGTQHALLALRRAVEKAPDLSAQAAKFALRIAPADFSKAIPEGTAGVPLLLQLASRSTDLRLSLQLAQDAISRDGQRGGSHLVAARLWTQAGVAKHDLCAERGSECLAEAERNLERAGALQVDPVELVRARAGWLAATGKKHEAFQLLMKHCPRRPQYRSCLGALLQLADSLSDADFRLGAEAYLDGLCAKTVTCHGAERHVAGAFERRGDLGQALTLLRGIAQRGTKADAWLDVARVAERFGRSHEAMRALSRAEKLIGPQDTVLQARAQRQRSALLRRSP